MFLNIPFACAKYRIYLLNAFIHRSLNFDNFDNDPCNKFITSHKMLHGSENDDKMSLLRERNGLTDRFDRNKSVSDLIIGTYFGSSSQKIIKDKTCIKYPHN